MRKGVKTNSRAKGAAGELELSHALQELGYDTRRGQQFCGLHGDADVVGMSDRIHIECKRVEALNLDLAYAQSLKEAVPGQIPVVMHRKNRQEWKVTLSLDDFVKLFKVWEADVR